MENNVNVSGGSAGIVYAGNAPLHVDNISMTIHKNEEIMNPEFAKFLECIVIGGNTASLIQELDKLGDRAVEIGNKSLLLHKSIRYKQQDILVMLLNRGLDIEYRDEDSDSPLLCAAYYLNRPAMEELLNRGADIHAVNKKGNSILRRLIYGAGDSQRAGREDEAKEALSWLLRRGLSIDITRYDGSTLIHAAAMSFNTKLLRYLVEQYNLDVNAAYNKENTPLIDMIILLKEEEEEEVQGLNMAACLLELGARTDTLYKGITPGEFALSKGYCKIAALLGNLTAQWNPELAEFLERIVMSGNTACLIQKLDKFGDRAVEIGNKSLLLHKSINYKQQDILVMLLNRGLDIEYKDEDSDSPLLYAAYYLNRPAMEELLNRGADINALTKNGNSILQRLIYGAKDSKRAGREDEAKEALSWLLRRGLSIDITRYDGSTLIHAAAISFNTKLLRYLVEEYNLDVNAAYNKETTPLIDMISYLEEEEEAQGLNMAACLLELGARTDTLYKGMTPGEFARTEGYWKIAAMLGDPTAQWWQAAVRAGTAAPVLMAIVLIYKLLKRSKKFTR